MMIKRLLITILFLITFTANGFTAKYAGEAFALGVGGRGLALGGAVIAGGFDGTSAYWNPAGMNYLEGRQITAMHAETFGSLLNHDFISYIDARKNDSSIIKSFGFYFYYLGGGGIKITQLDQFNRPFVISEESHGDYLIAGSVSGKISSKIDFGLTAKIIYRDLGTETGKGLTIDAGMLYRLNKFSQLGLMVTDITSGFIRYSGDTFDSGANSESIYPTIKPGIMLEHKYSDFTGRYFMSADIKFENIKTAAQYWSGSISLDSHHGWELDYKEIVSGRIGFDIGRFTGGGGIHFRKIRLDFAYLHHDELDETYRVSAGYQF